MGLGPFVGRRYYKFLTSHIKWIWDNSIPLIFYEMCSFLYRGGTGEHQEAGAGTVIKSPCQRSSKIRYAWYMNVALSVAQKPSCSVVCRRLKTADLDSYFKVKCCALFARRRFFREEVSKNSCRERNKPDHTLLQCVDCCREDYGSQKQILMTSWYAWTTKICQAEYPAVKIIKHYFSDVYSVYKSAWKELISFQWNQA